MKEAGKHIAMFLKHFDFFSEVPESKIPERLFFFFSRENTVLGLALFLQNPWF